jgi:hypothetical protein
MPLNYKNIIQSMSPNDIARPKALLQQLFLLHSEHSKSHSSHTLWGDRTHYSWLSQILLKTLAPDEKPESEQDADSLDLSAFLQILNDDPRASMLLKDRGIAALLNAFFSYYPEYVLRLRSTIFVEKLALDFSWVNECVLGLINQYLIQIRSEDDATREIACLALCSAAPILTEAQQITVIDTMLAMSEDGHEKAWIRIDAYRALAAITCYAPESKKNEIIAILSNRATQSTAMFQHYCVLEALGNIANTATLNKKIEITNLFTHLCMNANRDVRAAAKTARNIVYPNSGAAEPKPRRLSDPQIDVSAAESEHIQKEAVKMQYAKRIALIRKIALNHHGESIPHLDFDALAYIYRLNEVQHELQERESRAFIEPITQIIAEYCAPTQSF